VLRHCSVVFFAVAVGFCAPLSSGAAPLASRQSLDRVEVPARALVASDPQGRIAVLSQSGRELCWWRTTGAFQKCVAIASGRSSASPVILRGGESGWLACLGDGVGPPLECFVVDPRRGTIVGHLDIEDWPAFIWPGPRGWMVGLMRPQGGPAGFRELDDSGHELRVAQLPASFAKAVAAAGEAYLSWMPRPFVVQGELWAIPAGHYGLWRMDQPDAQEVTVPAPLFVTTYLVGATASPPLVAERLANMPPRIRQQFNAPRGGNNKLGPRQFSINGIRDVASLGHTAYVLVVTDPEAPEGGCRLDSWTFPEARISENHRLPGPCPRSVHPSPKGAWLRVGSRFVGFEMSLGSVH
jgi:hypothetical protein